MTDNSLLLNYKTLSKFQEVYYEGVLTNYNLVGGETTISKLTLPDQGVIDNFWGFVFKKDNTKYLLKSHDEEGNTLNLVDLLPIKPTSLLKVGFKNEVYYLIETYQRVKYSKKLKISFKECVNRLNSLCTTEPEQRTLFIIATIAQYYGRCYFRFATNPGFGKDSVVDTLGLLLGKINTITNPTVAKLESMSATNKLVVINEIVDIAQHIWKDIEPFLLTAGAFSPEIAKRSRAYENVGEFIDISDLSVSLFYNDIDMYPMDSSYVDSISKGAFLDRFPAFRFHGVLNEDFSKINYHDPENLVRENMEWYKELIHSLEYWVDKVNTAFVDKGFDIGVKENYSPRWKTSMGELNRFLALYADTDEEFERLKKLYGEAIKEYRAMIDYKPHCIEAGRWLHQNQKLFKDRLYSIINNDKQVLLK